MAYRPGLCLQLDGQIIETGHLVLTVHVSELIEFRRILGKRVPSPDQDYA
ncbi:MAG: hypothetical protein H0W99_01705 [Acidobacteria bacterium]|nr:hypothetical protein [Acidobacteriota bacterium]